MLTTYFISGGPPRRVRRRQRRRPRPHQRRAHGPLARGRLRLVPRPAQLHRVVLQHRIEPAAVRRDAQGAADGPAGRSGPRHGWS